MGEKKTLQQMVKDLLAMPLRPFDAEGVEEELGQVGIYRERFQEFDLEDELEGIEPEVADELRHAQRSSAAEFIDEETHVLLCGKLLDRLEKVPNVPVNTEMQDALNRLIELEQRDIITMQEAKTKAIHLLNDPDAFRDYMLETNDIDDPQWQEACDIYRGILEDQASVPDIAIPQTREIIQALRNIVKEMGRQIEQGKQV